jgi:multidrug efflux pump subunit AcrB
MENNQDNQKRSFSLTNFALDNSTSIFVLTLMILAFGLISYVQMPKELYPEATLPTIFINTPYPGNSAKDIENLVSRPIEKELQGISGIKYVKSNSLQDFSSITAEFETGFDIDEVKAKVKDAVDIAKSDLPNDLPTDPIVVDVNFSEIPIMTVNMSGKYPMAQLRKFAEFLQDQLEEINEVNKIDLKGALENEVKVNVDLFKMKSLRVSFTDIENAIRSENMNMSGGEILKNDFRRAIRVVGEFESPEQIENMIVTSENQKPIYLRDIATVSFGPKDRTTIARSSGNPVISLDIIKRKGTNLIDAADNVKETIKSNRDYFPEDLKISIFNDTSLNTKDQVDNLENSIISGVILVVLVLLFFLGLRNASFVGLAIPLSMLMGILLLNVLGVSLNIVVLFALILALGMLVDNAIVVVENIYRYRQEGYSDYDSSKYGTGEVAWPIIASTATTLAAFVPLAFWPGLMGEFMKYMPITLIIVLSSSLFVALVINPVFTYYFMQLDEKADTKSDRRRRVFNILIFAGILFVLTLVGHFTNNMVMRNLLGIVLAIVLVNFFLLRPATFVFQNKLMPALERAYNFFVKGALHSVIPYLVFIGAFVLLFGSIVLLSTFPPPIEFFPSADPLYVNAFIELPQGKDIEATDRAVKEIETKMVEVLEPYESIIDEILVQIGENTADPNAPPEPGVTPHKARVTVSFVAFQKRKGISSRDALNDVRDALKGYSGMTISVDKNADGPPVGKPINLEVKGEDINDLATQSESIISYFNALNIDGIEELKADINLGKPELIINVDREAARRYGVSTFAVADAIRTSVYGKEVSKFKQGEDEYDIYVRLDPKYRNNVNDLINQPVTFRSQSTGKIMQVPISAVATTKYTSTFNSIKRKNMDRMVTISSNVLEGYNANEIVAELQSVMEDYNLPQGMTYEFTGEQQQQAEDTAFLLFAMLIAVFVIFIILVTQFNSVTQPIIIVLSILFSTIGVFLGYVITGKTISVIFTGVGIISLAGIVVNNAIVLIDYINVLIKKAMEKEGVKSRHELSREAVKDAIVSGGATRLRPVLLTAITTVLGLVPLAMGININFFTIITELNANYSVGGDNTAMWGPMAWTVIYGLIFATFLTLVVVPVMYWLEYQLSRVPSKVKEVFTRPSRNKVLDEPSV